MVTLENLIVAWKQQVASVQFVPVDLCHLLVVHQQLLRVKTLEGEHLCPAFACPNGCQMPKKNISTE